MRCLLHNSIPDTLCTLVFFDCNGVFEEVGQICTAYGH